MNAHDERRKRIAREALSLIASEKAGVDKRLRDQLPDVRDIIGVSECARILGMSRQGVYNILNEQNRSVAERFRD